jgi:hypothetical protein
MYRGSSFLLQYAYTIHRGVVDLLVERRFSKLWKREFGAADKDTELVPIILEAFDAVRNVYGAFATRAEAGEASDTLVTKVMLGTFGCLPACDRYFIDGFKTADFPYSYVNRSFVQRVLHFCQANLGELRDEQARIERISGTYYPLMKLVDMYFWEIGFERNKADVGSASESAESGDAPGREGR